MPPAKRKEGAGRRQETRAHQNAESRKIGNTEGAENAEQWLEKMATDFRLSALCALCVSKAILQKAKKWVQNDGGQDDRRIQNHDSSSFCPTSFCQTLAFLKVKRRPSVVGFGGVGRPAPNNQFLCDPAPLRLCVTFCFLTLAHCEICKSGNAVSAETVEQWMEKMAPDFRLSVLCALCVSKAILQKAKKWGRTMEGRMIEEFKSMILHRSAPHRSAKLWLS